MRAEIHRSMSSPHLGDFNAFRPLLIQRRHLASWCAIAALSLATPQWATAQAQPERQMAPGEGAARKGKAIPSISKRGDEVLQFRTLQAERITVMENGGFWPTVALLQNGDLIVVARGGAPHGVTRSTNLVMPRLELVRSSDSGETWSEPVWVAASRPGEDLRDGFLTELKDGTLLLAFHIYKFKSATEFVGDDVSVYVTRSQDWGFTWSVPTKVETAPYRWGSPHRRIVELPTGTLLMAVNASHTFTPPWGDLFRPEGERELTSTVVRSRDGGKTWGDLTVISKGDETSLLLLPSGKLLAAVRGGPVLGGNKAVSLHQSLDEGRTWQNLGDVTEPSEQPGSLLLLKDGRILLSFGDRRKPFHGVQAMLSRDEGKTWDRDHRYQLAWDAPNTDCGYPESLQLADGRIFTVYYQVDDLGNTPASAKAKAVIWTVPK